MSTDPPAVDGPRRHGFRRESYPVGRITGTTEPGRRTRYAGSPPSRRRAVARTYRLTRCPSPSRSTETRTSLVRRARKIDRVLGRDLPRRPLRARLRQPVRAAGRHRAAARRPPTSGSTPSARPCSRPTPTRGRWPPPTARRSRRSSARSGFFRAKTESLLKLSAALVERHGGEVPPRLKDLVELPGVGRKTANVVLGNAFGIPGITVDTHFGRLVRRFGWTEETDPVKAEHAVGALFPKKRLDDAQPPPDLARPALLPRAEARLRGLPGGALVPVVRRGPDRPRDRGQAGAHRGPRMRQGARRCSPPCCSWRHWPAATTRPSSCPVRARPRSTVDTPELRELKAEIGIEDCVPGPGGGALPEITLPCLGGGTSVDLSSLKGPLVLNFWSPAAARARRRCRRCRRSTTQYGDQVPVLGVDFQRPVPRQRAGGGREARGDLPVAGRPGR